MNMAVLASGRGLKTQVIDLDRINDYFRMSDHIEMLLSRKIDVVSPAFAGKGVTQTVMPARVASAFDGDWDLVIFDVGGDQAGRSPWRGTTRTSPPWSRASLKFTTS